MLMTQVCIQTTRHEQNGALGEREKIEKSQTAAKRRPTSIVCRGSCPCYYYYYYYYYLAGNGVTQWGRWMEDWGDGVGLGRTRLKLSRMELSLTSGVDVRTLGAVVAWEY